MALVDYSSLLLDPNYLVKAVDGVLTTAQGFPHTFQVMDVTEGLLVGDASGVQVDSIKPVGMIRATEMTEKGLCRADLDGGELVMNRKTWRIESTRPGSGPNGESQGEIWLFLTEVVG